MYGVPTDMIQPVEACYMVDFRAGAADISTGASTANSDIRQLHVTAEKIK